MPFLKVNDIRLNYEQRGSGPPVLFLAGMGLDLRIWSKIVLELEHEATCILLDMRGSGKSESPRGPYTIAKIATEVEALLDHLGIQRATIVGHSMSSLTAIELTLTRHKRVRTLVLVGSAPTGRSDCLGSTPEATAALSRTSGTVEQIVRGAMTVCVGKDYPREHPNSFEDLIKERIEGRATAKGIAGQRAACAIFNATARLSKIHTPTIIIHGQNDQIVSHKISQVLAEQIPDTKLHLLQGVGHFPQWETPYALSKIISGII